MELINKLVIGVGGALVGGYIIYIQWKLNELKNILDVLIEDTSKKIEELEEVIKKFPTPAELAKAILKVKIPINSLPKDAQENLTQNVPVNPYGFPMNVPVPPMPPSGTPNPSKKADYIG